MNESEFNKTVDSTISKIEASLDRLEVDFDYEISDGMLTIEFENGIKLILSRQTPLTQLWLATPTGAYHFNYETSTQKWFDEKNKEELFFVLSTHCSEQSGDEIALQES